MKITLLSTTALLGLASLAEAQVVASDNFSYSGALTANGWVAHSGAGNRVIMANGMFATLDQQGGSGEDVNMSFAPFGATDTIYASFDLRLPAGNPVNPDASGLYLAHFKDSTFAFRARTGVLSPAGAGDFALAINADNSNLGAGASWATDLSFDTWYEVVISWNAGTGESRLWLDPVDESSTSIAHTGTFTGDLMEAFALRQSNDYVGFNHIDNVVVGRSFRDVHPPEVQISIGVRETEAGGGAAFTAIGANGGASGGIEWVNRDGQTLILDGTWQQFTFTLASDPITGFAGGTANGVLDGNFGTLEHIRVLNANGITDPISIWIDDVTNTITPGGATTFGDFEGFAQGTEVMFQEPGFSGSTAGNIVSGSASGADNYFASNGGTASYLCDFQFVDNTPTRWVRLTTFNASNTANPQIRFDQGSVVTFWMRGEPCQENLGSQGPGTAVAKFCGTGLNTGERSTYRVGGAPANALGLFAVSDSGQPDLSIVGGTLVSGTGVFFTAPIFADASGQLSFTVNGIGGPTPFSWVVQSLFLDTSLPQLVAFTNAIQARFAQ